MESVLSCHHNWYCALGIPSATTYSNEDGTGAATTEYAYTWYSGSFQFQQATTTLPAVSVDHNGSGASTVSRVWFDDRGNLAWTMDQLGRVTYYAYNSLTGRLQQVIEDIDADMAEDLELTTPVGWTLPASGGANLATEYQFDALGRVTQTLGAAHTADVGGTPTTVRTATWTFYDNANHETRFAQGYVVVSTGAAVIVGPVLITKTDRDGRTTERVETTYTGELANLASAAISQADYTAWTTYQYAKTRRVSMRVYDDIPASGPGTAGVNYEQTSYGYENYNQSGTMGRQAILTDASGTVEHVFFDARGNVLQRWIGTDDVPDSDYDGLAGIDGYDFRSWVFENPTATTGPAGTTMVLVSAASYDADGNLIESRAYFDTGSSDYYATLYQYDWRDRLTDVRSPLLAGAGQGEGTVTHYEYDNLGQVVWTKTYASDDFTLAAGELRAQSQSLYDNRDRIYESRVYEVDPTSGAIGDYLLTETWYDARGQVVKTATGSGLFQKYAYDGLGQLVASYTCYDADETAYAEADDVSGDTVVEQTRYWYDAAGLLVATATYQRLPDDTATTETENGTGPVLTR